MSASGAGTSDVSVAEKELQEYEFLYWLDPFIQQRKTKSNFLIAHDEVNKVETPISTTPNIDSDISDDENLLAKELKKFDNNYAESKRRKTDSERTANTNNITKRNSNRTDVTG